MQKNHPVTGKEKSFSPDQRLISTTDLRGRITHCNDVFIDVAGFSRDELIGQPHNIIRHPDMPAAAFQNMWSYLKAGQPWMGIVKNRCKNGDHYWVNAYVTPIFDGDNIVGYESVRTCPTREQVNRAEQIYSSINRGKKLKLNSLITLTEGTALLFLTATLVLLISQLPVIAAITGTIGLFVNLCLVRWQQQRHNQLFLKLLAGSFSDPLAGLVYANDAGPIGQIQVSILSLKAHLNTVITCIEELSKRVALEADKALRSTQRSQQAMQEQRTKTNSVASAMNEMTSAIGEASTHIQNTAQQTEEASQHSASGKGIAVTTRESIAQLQDKVNDISLSVEELSTQTENIASAANLIEGIADQTNLLALNAAIEAARAGEQGRGFAVVADEVRQLAQRTQSSTQEIHNIIQRLTAQAKTSVETAKQGQKDADNGLNNVMEAEAMLGEITSALSKIATVSSHMAASFEQQAKSSEEINHQVNHISSLAQETMTAGQETLAGIQSLKGASNDLYVLVDRFQR
ncbi:methyl-accepting chemotaxis protein [Spartinivicinus poritis]|uniref:PAS domain-containing methyl-accepting chemotaxis protein n=1 Tax=Spartinivicinus poritis TaxID=2994640 RepID=A0ABT5UEY0_9GAMM|nr:PAS domain-containing methyl-accepting chemotaxis protein [Spartinivicinus sp. A2-2]MDE1464943.1 PAS domain-containing methyl-accepting chemotaxis protein [Spartinivicinus sp. A2-2]